MVGGRGRWKVAVNKKGGMRQLTIRNSGLDHLLIIIFSSAHWGNKLLNRQIYKSLWKLSPFNYHIYPAIRRGFCPSRMTSYN